jgi:hypothetical protein
MKRSSEGNATVKRPLSQGVAVTQWVENPGGGRDRGPRAVLRAWAEALVRPRRLFRSAVAPGDQAPGLVFAAAVVAIEEGLRFLLVADAYPVLSGQPLLSGVFWLLFAVVLVTPAALHLTAALQTVLFIGADRVGQLAGVSTLADRAGVSETVQVLAYASAPCALAGLPWPGLRAVVAAYGAVLYLVGLAVVHDLEYWQSPLLGALPAAFVFGYGFRGVAAAVDLYCGSGVDAYLREALSWGLC